MTDRNTKKVTVIRLRNDVEHVGNYETRTMVSGTGAFVKSYQYSQGIFSYARTDDVFQAEDCSGARAFAKKMFKGLGSLEEYTVTMEKTQ